MATVTDVASWMLAEVEKCGHLYQEDAALRILISFGNEFIYTNDNGNYALAKSVLAAFKKISPHVVWERGEKAWRLKEQFDEPGRRGVD